MMKVNKRYLLMALSLVCLLLILLSGTALALEPTDYAAWVRSSFPSTDGLTLSGYASLDTENSRIQVVPNSAYQVGGVFTTDKVSMGSNGFSLAAQVYCYTTYTPADGFALVLSKDTNTCIYNEVGSTGCGGALGYKDMANSIAVQYFTYSVSDIALGINGIQNEDSSTYVGFPVPYDGPVYMWVDYDADNTALTVYAGTTGTRPADPVTTYTIDLSGYSDYYIGVTAATGDNHQGYALAQWYYDDYYHSSSLKLDGSALYTDSLSVDGIIAQSAENVTSTSATLRGVWGSDYDSGYTKGIEYYMDGDSGNPVSGEAAADGTIDLSGLTDGTLYDYRAYAVDDISGIYSYSSDKTFTTLDIVTVTVEGGGYIGDDPAATGATMDDGSRITVTAPVVEGKIFDYWDVGGSPVSSDNPYTFTVTGDVTITAVYFDGFAGLGTAASPYQIADKDDLCLLSDLVADGYDFAGRYFIVTQNIEMQNLESLGSYFTPIGDSSSGRVFSGTFDGNGKTISGLCIDYANDAGLFGYLDGATVVDLTVSGATVNSSTGAGVIVGYADNDCTITGCTVTGCDIYVSYMAGGIVGYAYENTEVSGCTVTGCTVCSVYEYTGGIVGYADYDTDLSGCTITDCDLYGCHRTGGMVGYLNESGRISGCSVTGSTIGSWYDEEFGDEYYSDYVGGIVGYAGYYTDFSGCTVTDCQIDGNTAVGGIAGYLYDYMTISNCTVTNNDDCTITSADECGGIVGSMNYVATLYSCTVSGYTITAADSAGGILGIACDDIKLIDCSVTGLTVNGYYAGGIAGYLEDYDTVRCCSVTDCVMSGDSCAGGIAAFMYCQPTVADCTVSGGSITAPEYAGGVIGDADVCDSTGEISNCKVTCDITAPTDSTYQYAGGILGYGYSEVLRITDCEYNGDITVYSTNSVWAGGIVGYNERYYNVNYGDAAIRNCVAYGTITAPQSSLSGSYVGGICGYNDEDYYLALTDNVAMQSSLTGEYVNTLYADSYAAPTVTACYANGSMALTFADRTGGAGTDAALSGMDSAFWTDLGFTPANGWQQTASGNVTAAPVEAHLAATAVYALTVSGNAVPYYMNMPLSAGSNGAYSVYAGMEITMKSADKDDKISGITINGASVDSLSFTVAGNTRVAVTMEENAGDFWVYDGEYIFGVYDENSTYGDIDWSDAVDLDGEPLSGTYRNANVYVLDYEEIYIDRLDLGYGSVICKDNYDSYFYLCGFDDDSCLTADRIVNARDSGAVYIDSLDVYANAVYINDELDIEDDSHVMADIVTIVTNYHGLNVYDSSSLTAGTIYAAVGQDIGGASLYLSGSAVLTADNIAGTLYFKAYGNAVADITGDLETSYFETRDNALVTIGGSLTTTYDESALYGTSLLDVGGTITASDGNYIYSLNAAILNAQSDGDTPYYYETSEAYIRTTLTGLPANTLMEFGTSGGLHHMDFYARTTDDGTLTVWLISEGGSVTATAEGIIYVGDGSIGAATIAMATADGILDVSVSADVPAEQVSGQAVTYSDIVVDSDNQTFVYDAENLSVYLTDANEQSVELSAPLSEGTYYLTVAYADAINSFYGTTTYTVVVRDQRTISFDANGGSSVDEVKAWKYDSLTLPTSARSGYRLTGWTDGAFTYAAGSAYPVYVDSTLTAQWTKSTSGGGGSSSASTYYTIVATAGAGGSISPSGSVTVTEGTSKTYAITADDGYVIDDVLVDGESVGAVSTYTFTAVEAAHTIKAAFVAGEENDITGQFTDLIPGAWYQEGIEYVLKAGLFNGTSTTTFSPNADMTRAMLVTVLWRLGNEPASEAGLFDDVADGLWYSNAIGWASANGIVSGYGNGIFGTDDSITREQIAVILYNYANFMGYDTTQTADLSQYSDNGEISEWAAGAMAWANGTGLIGGRDANTLAPGGNATRAEVAIILMRFISYYSE